LLFLRPGVPKMRTRLATTRLSQHGSLCRVLRMETSPVWFITGASSGFGKAFTEYAVEQGYRVVATARKCGAIEPPAARHSGRVLTLPVDVNNRAQIEEAVRQAIERFGAVDVLINNAGYGIVGAVEETPEEELRALMDTNFFGAVAVTRALLPHFRRQRCGAIVNISSLGGQLSMAGFGSYSASKFALEGISEALAQELKPLGIKVLIVEPVSFEPTWREPECATCPRSMLMQRVWDRRASSRARAMGPSLAIRIRLPAQLTLRFATRTPRSDYNWAKMPWT